MKLSELKFESTQFSIEGLKNSDGAFVLELVNSAGWKEFIGDSKVSSLKDAEKYIQFVLSTNDVAYWVVSKKEDKTPV